MYTIECDGKVIHSPLFIEDGYITSNPVITEELNKASSLEFIIPPTNPEYDTIQKLKSIVTVKMDGKELFRGRMLESEGDYYNSKTVYCEGELSFLLDSVMRPFEWSGSVSGLFNMIIENHNAQVENEKKFVVGDVTVTDPNDYIVRANESYSNTWECISEKLIGMLGGYIRIRDVEDVRYIDYVADFGSVNSQVIEFGENLIDITQYVNSEEVFTALIPTGADGLTIKSVNNNLDYIYNESGIELYGWIWKQVAWDDVTVAANLMTKAQQHLATGVGTASTMTIKAVDLSLIDVDIEMFKLGDMVRVLSLPHNIDKYMMVSQIVRDLEDPSNSEITLGAILQTSTDIMQKQNAIITK